MMNSIPETAPVKALIHAKRMGKYEFELYPHLWERKGFARRMKKVSWQHVFFNEANKVKVPKTSGIYMFVVAPRHAFLRDHTYIFYVGQAVNLHQRFDEYLTEELGEDLEHDRERIVDFLDRFRGFLYFNYFECARTELDLREYYLVDHIYPWGNTRHQKVAKATLLKAVTL